MRGYKQCQVDSHQHWRCDVDHKRQSNLPVKEHSMPSLGPTELIIILVIVVVLFGASRLRGIGGALGGSIREFKSAVRDDDAAATTTTTTTKVDKVDTTEHKV